MPQDYKNRASTYRKKKTQQQQPSVAWWKWLLIALLIALFIVFLVYLKGSGSESEPKTNKKPTATTPVKIKKTPKHQNKPRVKPVYEFYTILPETEISVPDDEINTRRREEFLGKRKPGHYTVQVGSFRHFIQADKLKAKLAFMGIESRVEKVTLEGSTWNRVKLGPFSSAAQISILKKRLRKHGIDTVVTEIKS